MPFFKLNFYNLNYIYCIINLIKMIIINWLSIISESINTKKKLWYLKEESKEFEMVIQILEFGTYLS